jgi:hypothetical protein
MNGCEAVIKVGGDATRYVLADLERALRWLAMMEYVSSWNQRHSRQMHGRM